MKLNPLRDNIAGQAARGGRRLHRAGHHHPGHGRACSARPARPRCTCASRRRRTAGRASTAWTPAPGASCSPPTWRSRRSATTSTSTRSPTSTLDRLLDATGAAGAGLLRRLPHRRLPGVDPGRASPRACSRSDRVPTSPDPRRDARRRPPAARRRSTADDAACCRSDDGTAASAGDPAADDGGRAGGRDLRRRRASASTPARRPSSASRARSAPRSGPRSSATSAASAACSPSTWPATASPVLVSSTDGVGTKALVAQAVGPLRHHRPRPGGHVRRRPRLPGRRAAVLPRLHRRRPPRPRPHRAAGRGRRRGLPPGRLRAHRRRDGRAPRRHGARRVRPRRLRGRRRRARPSSSPATRSPRATC